MTLWNEQSSANEMAEEWLCICPRCKKEHITKIFYTGNSKKPYIYCFKCFEIRRQMASDETEYKMNNRKVGGSE